MGKAGQSSKLGISWDLWEGLGSGHQPTAARVCWVDAQWWDIKKGGLCWIYKCYRFIQDIFPRDPNVW